MRKIADAKISLVVSPSTGWTDHGREVARALGTRFIFMEREAASGKMTLRRGFRADSGEAAVVIENVVATGGSTRDVIEILQASEVKVLAAGSIIDAQRSGRPTSAFGGSSPSPLCRSRRIVPSIVPYAIGHPGDETGSRPA